MALSAALIGAATILSSAPVQLSPSKINDIDATVETMRAAGGIPGIGFTLVEGASPRLTKGYGRRSLDTADAVGPRTLFSIGSFTKAFTATAVALQVREGRLGWDDPLVRHLPWFRTSDEWVTAHVTVRDLLSMRVGWPDGDKIIWRGGTKEEMIAAIPGLPVGEFRRTHGEAGNLSYFLLGQLLEATSGVRWDSWVTTRLLEPLGMKLTLTPPAVPAAGDVAVAHVRRQEGVKSEPTPRMPEHVYPVGGLHSNAEDMARWISFQLQAGRGLPGVPEIASLLEELHRPQVLLGNFYQSWAEVPGRPAAYAMGWIVHGYRGTKVLEHGGAWGGFTALLVLLPERNLGFAILSNLNDTAALPTLRTIRNTIMDTILD
jgi:CubicO group peptidase (beta-lactamase class C family)